MYSGFLKRFFDFFAALLLLIMLSPVYLIVGMIVLVSMGRPLLFIHERPGRNEKVFKLYKFRSMKNSYDKLGNPFSDEERVTRVGIFLRKTSLDELPEIYNVLLGDMSFIGPRPLIKRYLPYYTEDEKRRHDVRPGITGLAQINGRNFLDWDERLRFDVFYVDHLSCALDFKILLKTIGKVLKQEDVGLNIVGDFDSERKERIKNEKLLS